MDATQKQHLLEGIFAAGIVGMGGAGFPAHVKYATKAKTLIVNGCECEPLLKTDVTAMALYPEQLFKGIAVVQALVGAQRVILAVKKKHADLHALLQPMANENNVELLAVGDFYPAGDEQSLIYECLGETLPPVSLPSALGVVVANSSTLMAVAAAEQGAPLVERLVTVTGAVRNPSVFAVPVGVSVLELIEVAGGVTENDAVVLLGGPMMGNILDEVSTIASAVVTKALGGIIVLPKDHYLHRMSRLSFEHMRRRASTACIQCRLCSELCPRYLIGHPFETHRIMRAFAHHAEFESGIAELAFMCCECGVCEHVACPMGLSPCSINRHIRQELRAQKRRYEGPSELVPEHSLWYEYRKVPINRLVERLGIAEYMALSPGYAGPYTPQEVHIPVQQHIGAPSTPCVKVGDIVTKNTLLATVPEGALGATIHASIDGQVVHLGETIHIKRVAQ